MRDIRSLFEYQKFKPNPDLQSRINAVTQKYLSDGVELDDEELNIAAAGESHQNKLPLEKPDGHKR